MSEVDWVGSERAALVGLVESMRKLKTSKPETELVTKAAAARRLKVTTKQLRLLIALDLVETVHVGRRELIFL